MIYSKSHNVWKFIDYFVDHTEDARQLWKQRIFVVLVGSGALIGIAPFVSSVLASFRENDYFSALFFLCVYTLVLIFFLYKRISFRFRAILILLLFDFVGTLLFAYYGYGSIGRTYLFCSAVFAGIVLGLFPALLALSLNGIILTVLAVLRYHNVVGWDFSFAEYVNSAIVWFTWNIAVTLGVVALIRGLEESLQKQTQLIDSLKTAAEELEKEMNESKRLEGQLVQTQKMRAIGALAGGVAHDFNNILSIIIGNTELAMFSLEENKEAHEDLSEVLKASRRARDVVRQILLFSRQQKLTPSPLQLSTIVKEVLRMIRVSLPSNIEIVERISTEDSTILNNPTNMHQVLLNLCTNAGHAMKGKGGTLTVALDEVEISGKEEGALVGIEKGTYMRMTVSDTGAGIPDDVLERIFEPYFTTKPAHEGTGMGLSVVFGIIKNASGHVTVETEVGKGTSFHVFLPKVEMVQRSSSSPPRPKMKGRERILFVDDEEAIVALWSKLLSRASYKVTATTSSPQALELFSADPFGYDLVITDATMPDMTGLMLIGAMSSIRRDMRFILCTGNKDELRGSDLRQYRILEVVEKPLSVNEFLTLIEKTLACD